VVACARCNWSAERAPAHPLATKKSSSDGIVKPEL
jgi:hypothetical protein